MKIDIGRKGTKVVVSVSLYIPCWETRVFTLDWECGNEAYAGLLTKLFHGTFTDRIQEIRRKAYEQGWNDHKKRKPRETYFSGCINA